MDWQDTLRFFIPLLRRQQAHRDRNPATDIRVTPIGVRRLILVGVLGIPMFGWSGVVASIKPLVDDPEVRRFIDDMVDQHGFARSDLDRLLADAELLPTVLDAIARPAESKPWYQYRALFVTPSRIEGGLEFWRAHQADLTRAAEVFGVSPEVIVAIIGVETRYGARGGRYRVLDALSTLAFRYPKRSRFFRGELEQFLLLTREEGLEPRLVKGSYAGAIGLPQFIASSYRRYAVDFDGDNVRDLITNPRDAIGSVANYLSRHGWRKGQGVVLAASLHNESARELLDGDLKPHIPLSTMKARGVAIERPAPDTESGALIELETEDGPEYWVGLQNFYTITRYNHSPLYAMAVQQLAQAIREQFGAVSG